MKEKNTIKKTSKKVIKPPKSLRKGVKNNSKKNNRKLGMGLSSLLSKDHELASVIKTKVENQARSSSLKIEMPKLSKKDGAKLSILNMKPKDLSNQKNIPIQDLISGKFQPRKTFDQAELEELAESIKTNGVLQPILVRPLTNQGSSFEIIAGERRWRASQIAKLHEVPVIIREFDDETAIGVAMIENLQTFVANILEIANIPNIASLNLAANPVSPLCLVKFNSDFNNRSDFVAAANPCAISDCFIPDKSDI